MITSWTVYISVAVAVCAIGATAILEKKGFKKILPNHSSTYTKEFDSFASTISGCWTFLFLCWIAAKIKGTWWLVLMGPFAIFAFWQSFWKWTLLISIWCITFGGILLILRQLYFLSLIKKMNSLIDNSYE